MTDERYVVIDGRRWRTTDPSIPAALRAELVGELMAARRAVGAATRRGDDEAEAAARRRVQDAKVALGERGEAWWETPTDAGRRQRIASTVLALLRSRRPESSICPSDAARAVGGSGWRSVVPTVRAVAAELSNQGVIGITQGATSVDVRTARGPVRLRRGPRWSDRDET